MRASPHPISAAALPAIPASQSGTKMEEYGLARRFRVVQWRKGKNSLKTQDKEEREMRFTKVTVIAVVIFTIVMGGLFVGGGGGGARVQQGNSVSLGQQLEDLQAAYEKGIITEKEYNKSKKQLLKNYK
jgi:hypothetical protein